jgi:dihydroorotase
MVKTGLMTWRDVAQRMSVNPAKIGKVSNQGQALEKGSVANLVVFNPAVELKVDPTQTQSGSRNTPYRELVLPGQVVATIYLGTPTVLNAELVK